MSGRTWGVSDQPDYSKVFPVQRTGRKKTGNPSRRSRLYRLLLEGIEEFRQLGEVYLSEEVNQWKIRKAKGVQVGVSAAEGWLNLKIDAEGMSGAELAKILGLSAEEKILPFKER